MTPSDRFARSAVSFCLIGVLCSQIPTNGVTALAETNCGSNHKGLLDDRTEEILILTIGGITIAAILKCCCKDEPQMIQPDFPDGMPAEQPDLGSEQQSAGGGESIALATPNVGGD